MATAYRMEFSTEEGTPVSCLIWDTTTYSEPEPHGYIDITGTGAPLILSVVDNDEDKFTPIKALQLDINFLSTNQVNINNFTEGDDNRWYVEVFYNDSATHIFKGFLVTDDLNEQFLCHPNEVNLVATDGLGLLKDMPLTAFDGTNPKGVFALITFIAFALEKTGLQLNINVIFNLRNKAGEHGFMHTFLDSKTFEAGIGASVSCYEALEFLLGENCYLTQAFGEWWIIRIAEHMNTNNTVYKFDHYSVALSLETQSRVYLLNGVNPAYFSHESATVRYIRPNKSVKEVFSYEYPQEIIDNIDFNRGDFFSPLLVTVSEIDYKAAGINISDPPAGFDATNWGATGFTLDDWALFAGNPYLLSAGTATVYIKRVFELGYEKGKYVVIKPNDGTINMIRSNPFPLGAGDRFDLSVDFRGVEDTSNTNSLHYIHIVLVGDDGNTYTYGGQSSNEESEYTWKLLDNTTGVNGVFYKWNGNDVDERQWQTLSARVKPAPVSGGLHLYLPAGGVINEFHYQNLNFSYIPLINGSYNNYKGNHYKVSQNGNYKAVRERDVMISEAPRKIFKGSLLRVLNDGYQVTDGFYDYDENPIPTIDQYHPFGWWQAYGVWNQHNRLFRSFEFTAQGLISNTNFPAMIHRFLLADDTAHTRYKVFMLLHYEIDIKLCEWSGVMVEVKDVNINKDYSTPVEFRYTEER